MAETATYNDGFYTPSLYDGSPASTPDPYYTPPTTAYVAPSSTEQPWSQTSAWSDPNAWSSSSSAAWTDPASTSSWAAWSSSSSVMGSPTSLAVASSVPATSAAPPPASTSAVGGMTITTTMPPSSTSSLSTTLARPDMTGAATSGTTKTTFKPTYLIPVFVILPIIIIVVVLALTRGKCWGPRDEYHGGGGGSTFGFMRNWGRKSSWGTSPWMKEDEDTGQMVRGRLVSDHGDGDEEAAWEEKARMGDDDSRPLAPDQSGYEHGQGSFMQRYGPGSFFKGLSRKLTGASAYSDGSSGVEAGMRPPAFLAVPYNALDAPFDTPSRDSRTRYDYHDGQQDRGEKWDTDGSNLTQVPSRRELRSKQPSAKRWGGRRYRAKSQKSMASRVTYDEDEDERIRKPSHGFRVVRESDEEEEDGYDDTEDLDAFLRSGRVGDDQLAKDYLAGKVGAQEIGPSKQMSWSEKAREALDRSLSVYSTRSGRSRAMKPTQPANEMGWRQHRVPSGRFEAEPLPSFTDIPIPRRPEPVTRALVSPVKSTRAATGPRAPAPSTPTHFIITSNANTPTYTPPYSSAPRPAFTSAPRPLNPAHQPELFFSPDRAKGAKGGQGGSSFEPGKIKASESRISLGGLDSLVFADKPVAPSARPPPPRELPRSDSSHSRLNGPREMGAKPVAGVSAVATPPRKLNGAPPDRLARPLSSRDLFNPSFGDGPELKPLSPSRVQYEIKQIEQRAMAPPSGGRSQRISPRGPRDPPPRMPLPPSPTKLLRSTTAVATRGEDSDSEGEDTKRLSGLVLHRSKTAISAYTATSVGLDDNEPTQRQPVRSQAQARPPQPARPVQSTQTPPRRPVSASQPASRERPVSLANDPKRLSALLRAGNSSDGTPKRFSGTDQAKGTGLDAMMRRGSPRAL